MPHQALPNSHPQPLGATPITGGTNFVVYSSVAEGVDLCLYAPADLETEVARFPMTRALGDLWHVAVSETPPGTPYGFRVSGPYEPGKGARCNPAKLLLDPYTRAIAGSSDYHPSMQGASWGVEDGGEHPVELDSGAAMPKSIVVNGTFDWGEDKAPSTPWEDTVLYEMHIKGFTKEMPGVPKPLRGTYAGLANQAATDYLRDLGITAVEILPLHHHLDDGFLLERDLTNYWGYNTTSFFAPHPEYAEATDPLAILDEFRGMIKALHAAGIEVILDVVYNHTAEGGPGGPTLNLRGLDDGAYYKHSPKSEYGEYWDCTGCGNTLNMHHPRALQLVLDSLRYWVSEMHIDGFRFDLASTLARGEYGFEEAGAFFKAIFQDPLLSTVKLIAEPWDVGQMDSYQLGAFPHPWVELNGKFRDTARRFWRGDGEMAGDMAGRLTGSQRIFGASGRGPLASINFVTCHDGFTLRDLVTYESKNNLANGEENRDGTDNNHAWNCGVEGETDAPAIQARRRRQQRNFLATTILSAGVPYLTAGDERDRTQGGNNNTYCQDNPLSWIDWTPTEAADELHAFTRALLAIRKANPIFRRRSYYTGKPGERGARDVAWFAPDGSAMQKSQWHADRPGAFSAVVTRAGMPEDLAVTPPAFLLIFNASKYPVIFHLPGTERCRWTSLVDTSYEPSFVHIDDPVGGSETHALIGHAFALFALTEGSPEEAQELRAQATESSPEEE